MSEENLLPLHQAILDGNLETAKQLVSNGADINIIDEKGRGAAYYAVFSRRLKMLKWVFSQGVSADYKESDGETLLHMAAGEGMLDMVKYLMKEHHLDINALSNDCLTPLGTCMIWTQMEVACCLIENGAKNIGEIHHFEALLKYIAKKIQDIKSEIEDYNKDEYLKRISKLNDFIITNSAIEKKPKNYIKINSDIEKVLLKLGISKGKELIFYKKYLDWNDKEEIIKLFNSDNKNPQIRPIIWKCYLQNHITKFCTAVYIYPAYLLPFTKKEVERDWKKTGEEGIDVADFIKDIETIYPKFGRDYYYLKDKSSLWFSLPSKPKNGDSYIDADLCIENMSKLKDTFVSFKYRKLFEIWRYIEHETTCLLIQSCDYFYE